MLTYSVKRVTKNPDWKRIPTVKIENVHKFTAEGVEAFAQVCYNDDEFIVHMYAVEKNIRAEEHAPLSEACSDSCLEFFLSPLSEDTRYINIEIAAGGAMYLGFGSNVENLMRLIPEKQDLLKTEIKTTKDGWEVFYKVPFWFIRQFFPQFAAASGKVMRANFYKCGDKTDHEHYLTWSPIVDDNDNFHTPKDFGVLVFE